MGNPQTYINFRAPLIFLWQRISCDFQLPKVFVELNISGSQQKSAFSILQDFFFGYLPNNHVVGTDRVDSKIKTSFSLTTTRMEPYRMSCFPLGSLSARLVRDI